MDIFNKDLDVEEIDIENSIKTSYLDYSMSVIIETGVSLCIGEFYML